MTSRGQRTQRRAAERAEIKRKRQEADRERRERNAARNQALRGR